MILAARTGAWAKSGAKLPYDAEVEWIESTGTEFIDSGIIGTSAIEVRSKCALLYMTNGYSAMWGSRVGSRNNDFQVYYNNSSVGGTPYSIVLRTGSGQKEISASSLGIEGSLLDKTLDITAKSGTVIVNGITFPTPLFNFTTPHSILLFCEYSNNISANFGRFRYDSWSAKYDGMFVSDLIPVRFTNENGVFEGAMFDRVSGQLFRNQGTGAFVIGPDKTT